MPEEIKHPVILSKDFHIADLILRHIHGGGTWWSKPYAIQTMSEILDSWCHSIDQKNPVSMCFLSAYKCYSWTTADLPPDRVSPDDPPFTDVGVDYTWVRKGPRDT